MEPDDTLIELLEDLLSAARKGQVTRLLCLFDNGQGETFSTVAPLDTEEVREMLSALARVMQEAHPQLQAQ